MSKDRAVMTLTPINGLLDVVKYNLARKNKDLFFYELGKRYEIGHEKLLLAGALTGELSNTAWQGKKEIVDFYTVKGILESLFNKLGLAHLTFEPMRDYKNLHPGQSAYIKDRTGIVGYIGKLHPEYETNNDLKDVFVFELDLLKMYTVKRPLKKVKTINKFPSIYRDIAIVVDNKITAKELTDVISKAGKRMLINIHVFDLYVGGNVGENKKSLAIRMEFSDLTKTLETTEVDNRIKEILGIIGKQFKAVLR